MVIELGAPIALIGRQWAWRWCLAAWSFHVAVVLSMSVTFPYELVGVAYLPVLLATAGVGAGGRSRQVLRGGAASRPAKSGPIGPRAGGWERVPARRDLTRSG